MLVGGFVKTQCRYAESETALTTKDTKVHKGTPEQIEGVLRFSIAFVNLSVLCGKRF